VRVRAAVAVPAEHLDWLREVRVELPELSTAWTEGEPDLELARTRFVAGDAHGVTYTVEPEDLRGLFRSLRLASSNADVTVLMLHVHQGDRPGELPPAFLRELSRAAIDVGADVVAVSGPHRLGPVELHEGRPILYGLGNFIWSDLHEPLPAYFWERTRRSLGDEAPDPSTATDADLLEVLNADAFDDPEVFRAVIARITVTDRGVETRLHPVELGRGQPLTRRGIPRTAGEEQAEAILATIADRSAALEVSVLPDGQVHAGV
jgi:poly-gamma-glutamate synthesis protein (capsule biosynthesis protein)